MKFAIAKIDILDTPPSAAQVEEQLQILQGNIRRYVSLILLLKVSLSVLCAWTVWHYFHLGKFDPLVFLLYFSICLVIFYTTLSGQLPLLAGLAWLAAYGIVVNLGILFFDPSIRPYLSPCAFIAGIVCALTARTIHLRLRSNISNSTSLKFLPQDTEIWLGLRESRKCPACATYLQSLSEQGRSPTMAEAKAVLSMAAKFATEQEMKKNKQEVQDARLSVMSNTYIGKNIQ